MPSEVIQIPREKVLAFVTRSGSGTSHAAIITRCCCMSLSAGRGRAAAPPAAGTCGGGGHLCWQTLYRPGRADPAPPAREKAPRGGEAARLELPDRQTEPHHRRAGNSHLRQHHRAAGHRAGHPQRRGRSGTDAQRIFVPQAPGPAQRGGAGQRLPRGHPPDERQADRHPHAGFWRAQADRAVHQPQSAGAAPLPAAAQAKAGSQPLDGLRSIPHLPGKARCSRPSCAPSTAPRCTAR